LHAAYTNYILFSLSPSFPGIDNARDIIYRIFPVYFWLERSGKRYRICAISPKMDSAEYIRVALDALIKRDVPFPIILLAHIDAIDVAHDYSCRNRPFVKVQAVSHSSVRARSNRANFPPSFQEAFLREEKRGGGRGSD